MHTRLNRTIKVTAAAVALLSGATGRSQELSLGKPSDLRASAQVAAELAIGDTSQDEAVAEQQAVVEEAIAEDRETEIINERYASGAVKVRREVTQDAAGNYVLHGEWAMWDEKGNPIAQGTFRDHQRHGTWIRWHRNRDEAKLFSEAPYNEFEPPFKSQAVFQDGQLHGTWLITDARNRKVSEWNFTAGQRNGLCTWYYPTGHKMEEVTYRNGLLDGHRYRWDKAARVILEEEYAEGRKSAPRTDFHGPNQKKTEGMYLHAQFVLETPDDWWNAVPATFRQVGQDVRHGSWSSFYKNGRKQQEGRFENDREIGDFVWWYENGQVMTKGSWLDGKRHGLWVWYHENGQKSVQGEFINGEPAGPWAYWKPDGRLYQKADFTENEQAIVATPDAEPLEIDSSDELELGSVEEGDMELEAAELDSPLAPTLR